MEYRAHGQNFSYHSIGEKKWGENITLLHQGNDLTTGKKWHRDGFTIQELFDPKIYHDFKASTSKLLLGLWQDAGLRINENSELHQYHTCIQNPEQHMNAVEETKLLSVHDFPVPISYLEDRISEICQTTLITRNPFDGQRIFHFRVIRPGRTDNNPLHRDVWLEDYDDCINLYIPVAGSSELTSLMIIPGSHLWPESHVERTVSGADINGVKFNVPAVTDIRPDFTVIRPSPEENQVLVFSPYLIHGGAVNSSSDRTRISIEIRLWKS